MVVSSLDVERAAALLRKEYGADALQRARELEARLPQSEFAKLVRQRLEKLGDRSASGPGCQTDATRQPHDLNDYYQDFSVDH